MKTAIILGATGLTGGILLKKLLRHQDYSEVKVFTRRAVGLEHPKMKEYVGDLFELEGFSEEFKADELFCCVGSTKAKTPDNDVYRKVDYGIPVTAAELGEKNGIKKMLVVSALGADEESRFFYNRIKGEMERDVLKKRITEVYFFQPSLIGGERQEKRTFESLWKKAMKVGDHLLVGPLKKYRSIDPETIVDAMLLVAKNGYKEAHIESDEIKKIAKSSSHAGN